MQTSLGAKPGLLLVEGADYPRQIFVIPGNGDGTLQSIPGYAGAPGGVATADFNGDGVSDIAYVTSQKSQPVLSAAVGRGDGTFGTLNTVVPAAGIGFVVAGDFNGNSKTDIVGVIPGNGEGSPERSISAGWCEPAFAVPVIDNGIRTGDD